MASQETTNAARMGLSPSGGDCREIMIRTVYAEAFGEGDIGMEAVAWVIRNRAEQGNFGGKSVGEVCLKGFQFEPWRSPSGLARINGLEKDSENYKRIAEIVDRVLQSEKAADITGGSTHFANAEIVRNRRNGGVTDWMADFTNQGKAFDLGRHTFYGGNPKQAEAALSKRGADSGFQLTSDPGALYYTRKDAQNNPSLLYLSTERTSSETTNNENQNWLAQMMGGMVQSIASFGGGLMMLFAAAFAGISGRREEEPAPVVAENTPPPATPKTESPAPPLTQEAKIAAAQVTIPNGCTISNGVCSAPEGSQPVPNALAWDSSKLFGIR